LLTTPLYYVNDLPHIGNAYTTIAADVVTRFERLRGKSVLLITGTDEHGKKIQRTAEVKESPQEYCDEIVVGFVELATTDIQYDRSFRTTALSMRRSLKSFPASGEKEIYQSARLVLRLLRRI